MSPRTPVTFLVSIILPFLISCCGNSSVKKARIALASGQPDIAMSVISSHLAEKPGDADALIVLGDIYVTQASTSQKVTSSVSGAPTTPNRISTDVMELIVKAQDAYKSAANAAPEDCVAVSRSLSLRLYSEGSSQESYDDFIVHWDRCHDLDVLEAALATKLFRFAGLSDESELANMLRIGEYVGNAPWDKLKVYEISLAEGSYALVPPGKDLPTDPVDESIDKPSHLEPFSEIRLIDLSDSQAVFEDEAHEVIEDNIGWIWWKKERQGGCGDTGLNRNYSRTYRCIAKHLLSAPSEIINDSRSLKQQGEIHGGVECTGNVRQDPNSGWIRGYQCEVRYSQRRAPKRKVAIETLIPEPQEVVGRGKWLQSVSEMVDEATLEHLVQGELATGIPAILVRCVVPDCRFDPIAGVEFTEKGEVIRTCEVDQIIRVTTRSGLVESVEDLAFSEM